jgi:CheY-like chemotaxis protein
VKQRILVIDPDIGFATLLKESLEQTQLYEIITAHDGQAAPGTLAQDGWAMMILDLGLNDPPAAQVAQSVRAQHPELPLIVIPLDGDTPPPEISALGIQGVLTKPFFLPDLPSLVARAMSAQSPTPASPAMVVTPEPPPQPALVEPSHGTRSTGDKAKLAAPLSALARELNAEAVMLTCGDDLVAHAGRLAREEAEPLGRVIVASWRASAQVAKLLGREKVRFEQSMHEGGDYVLYSLSVAGEMVLSVALNSHTPLGIVRYHTKHTAETIAKLTTSA